MRQARSYIQARQARRWARLAPGLEKGKSALSQNLPDDWTLAETIASSKRLLPDLGLSEGDIDDILDYLSATASLREIFYLWRPVLRNPKDDMVLELAVESRSDFIVTYNLRDFAAAEGFGIEAVTAKQFLQRLGEIP
jgi:predicted nucleic acid-binding protein